MKCPSLRLNISPRRTDSGLAVRIATLPRQRLIGKHIAMETSFSPATVSSVVKRAGLSQKKDLAPIVPILRCDYADPGG
jgi:hypothetical protein